MVKTPLIWVKAASAWSRVRMRCRAGDSRRGPAGVKMPDFAGRKRQVAMFRPLELFIGLRYARAKRRNRFISFISTVSIVCISISVIALITVMSVMNGFDYQMRTRILGAVSHATISGIGQSIEDWPRALKIAEAN